MAMARRKTVNQLAASKQGPADTIKSASNKLLANKIIFDNDLKTGLSKARKEKLQQIVLDTLKKLSKLIPENFRMVFSTDISIIIKSSKQTNYNLVCRYLEKDHTIEIYFIDSEPDISFAIPGHDNYFDYLLRAIKHETQHVVTAIQNTDSSCNPASIYASLPKEQRALLTLPNSAAELENALKQGDKEILQTLQALLVKSDKGTINAAELSKLKEYRKSASNYLPFRRFYSYHLSTVTNPVLHEKIENEIKDAINKGKPYYMDKIIPPFYAFNYIEYPDGRRLVSGYNVENYEDKLLALVMDTKQKLFDLGQPPYATYRVDPRTGDSDLDINPVTLVVEHDAFSYETSPIVFFKSAQNIRAKNNKDSLCALARNHNEQDIIDDEMAEFFGKISNKKN